MLTGIVPEYIFQVKKGKQESVLSFIDCNVKVVKDRGIITDSMKAVQEAAQLKIQSSSRLMYL